MVIDIRQDSSARAIGETIKNVCQPQQISVLI